MTDIALALHALVPGAEYFGSLTDNSEASYAALDWRDERPKPTWSAIQSAETASPADTLAAKLAMGIAVTSSGTPAISATYALDRITLEQIGAVARDAAAGLGLPGGGVTFAYPDIAGAPKVLTAAAIQDLYKAMRDCVFALNQTAAALTAGGTAGWPGQSATIA